MYRKNLKYTKLFKNIKIHKKMNRKSINSRIYKKIKKI
jgi:hypothetical protein